jgi:hypothetical protein
MGLLFRNWLEEGFYEEDEMGDLTKIEDPIEISKAARKGNLYEHDGMGMNKIHSIEDLVDKLDKQ